MWQGKIRFITFEDVEDVPLEKIEKALETVGCSFECREVTDYVEDLEAFVESSLDNTINAMDTFLGRKFDLPSNWKEKYARFLKNK